MNEDGTMSRVPELAKFARKHNLLVATIADLIQYRMLFVLEHGVDRCEDAMLTMSPEYGSMSAIQSSDH